MKVNTEEQRRTSRGDRCASTPLVGSSGGSFSSALIMIKILKLSDNGKNTSDNHDRGLKQNRPMHNECNYI